MSFETWIAILYVLSMIGAVVGAWFGYKLYKKYFGAKQ